MIKTDSQIQYPFGRTCDEKMVQTLQFLLSPSFYICFQVQSLVRLALLEITFFFVSRLFYELWHSHNDSRSSTEVLAWPQPLSFTEVQQRWSTLVLGCMTA